MKKLTILGISVAGLSMLAGFILLSSFTVVNKFGDEFLKQLGISKTDADSRIINSMLDGSLNEYGLSKAKNVALGNRAAVTTDLLAYVKKRLASPAFVQEYNALRDRNKPKLIVTKTPDEMYQERIATSKKDLADVEANAKKNTMESLKEMYTKMIADAQKRVKEAEDPNGDVVKRYRQRYAEYQQQNKEINDGLLARWEGKYPANPNHFIKKRLEQFLQESATIDFDAETYTKGGTRYFTNRAYESKNNYWKMGFRAGKEAVTAARAFVTQWISEIK
jgi:hypothetical protein